MADEPDLTPEELAEAQAYDDYLAGRPSALPQDVQETLALVEYLADPRVDESIARVEKRLQFRRRPRWLVRGGVIGGAIAASVLLWWLVTPRMLVPAPTPELLQAAKTSDPRAVEQAMQAYRRELVATPALRPAAEVHARADAAIAANDLPAARAALTTLTNQGGGVIERDAWFRLATIDLREGRQDSAIASADRGLSLGKPADIFTVNLYLARAAAHRERGELAAAAADLHQVVVLLDEMSVE